jgi:hypothetical protein
LCTEPLPNIIAFIQQKGHISLYQTASDSNTTPRHILTAPLPFNPTLCIELARLKPLSTLIEYFCTSATKQYIIQIEYKLPDITVTIVKEQESGLTKSAIYVGGDRIVTRNDAEMLVYQTTRFEDTVVLDVKVDAVIYDEELNCVFGCNETHFVQITASQKINYLYAFPSPVKVSILLVS